MPSDNIPAPILGMLTFLLLHKISLAIKWNRGFFHSLHILVSLFLWVLIFGQTYQHSLALSGTLVLYECVWSASHYTLGGNVEYQLNRRLDGQEIWPGSSGEVESLLNLPEPNLNYTIWVTAY